jgi:hypothetical protein
VSVTRHGRVFFDPGFERFSLIGIHRAHTTPSKPPVDGHLVGELQYVIWSGLVSGPFLKFFLHIFCRNEGGCHTYSPPAPFSNDITFEAMRHAQKFRSYGRKSTVSCIEQLQCTVPRHPESSPSRLSSARTHRLERRAGGFPSGITYVHPYMILCHDDMCS